MIALDMSFKPFPGFVPPFQDLPTLAAHICLGASTIERMVKDGRFPRPRRNKAGKNLGVWREVEQFLAAPEDEAVVLVERIRADCMEAMLEKQAERQSRPRNRRRPIRPA
jgi:predicted DNA-binding transcriptional regulator AlpA